jgi:hypothetical protein
VSAKDPLKERLMRAIADESPIDREEHAGRIAKVVERARGSSVVRMVEELLERTRGYGDG